MREKQGSFVQKILVKYIINLTIFSCFEHIRTLKEYIVNMREIKMKQKKNYILVFVVGFLILSVAVLYIFFSRARSEEMNVSQVEGIVISVANEEVKVQDKKGVIYTVAPFDNDIIVGSKLAVEYTGLLNEDKYIDVSQVVDYKTTDLKVDENGIPVDWLDNGIFHNYYILANNKLKGMTLDEKIAQLLLVRYPDNNQLEALKKFQFGGYLFFEKDFRNKTAQEVKKMISQAQQTAKIPLLTAVDEEGGKVVRVSSNPNLASHRFLSPQELYRNGGFEKIKADTIEKSNLLKNLGLNLNLAPVVDVSTSSSDYMYDRTLGENSELTSVFAKTVIAASKGTDVSYTLKHFPGYGNNADTHLSGTQDERSYDDIKKNDLPPFESGIQAGAEAILVSHNIVKAIDSKNAASLSPNVHNLLRNELGFTGIIITDDIAMKAVSDIPNVTVEAILAGNDLIITTDYEKSFSDIKQALKNNIIDESIIDKLAFRVIAWKYYKGLMFENMK